MRSLLYGLAAFSFLKTSYATLDANGNYILEPISPSDLGLKIRDDVPEQKMTILEPILPSEIGIVRRHGSSVGLQNDTTLFWGGGAGGESLIFIHLNILINFCFFFTDSNVMVNMTLSTGETQLILSMDHFKEDLANVTCTDTLSLAFKNNDVYQEAIDDWEWVNFNDKRTFVMIVNYGGCSAESGRQPWVISAATYDDANFRVTFTGKQKDWSELQNPYRIEFGSYVPEAGSPLAARGLFDFVDDGKKALEEAARKAQELVDQKAKEGADLAAQKLKDAEEAAKKLAITGDKSLSISLEKNIDPVIFTKSTNFGLELTVGCDDCKTSGQLLVKGAIKGTVDGIQEAWIQVNPEAGGIGFDFNPSIELSGTLGSGWEKTFDLAVITPPLTSIPGIIQLGPKATIRAGFALAGIQGSATVKSGMTGKISESAVAKMDFQDIKNVKFDKWNPEFTTKPVSVDAQLQGSLSIFSEIGIEVGLKVFDKFDMGVGLEIDVPRAKASMSAEYSSTGGVCPNHPEEYALKFDYDVGAKISMAGWTTSRDKPIWSAPIWEKADMKTFPGQCVPFKNGPKLPIALMKTVSGSGSVASSTVATEKSTSTTKTEEQKQPTETSSGTSSPISTPNPNEENEEPNESSTSKVQSQSASSSAKVSATQSAAPSTTKPPSAATTKTASSTKSAQPTTKVGTDPEVEDPEASSISPSETTAPKASIASPAASTRSSNPTALSSKMASATAKAPQSTTSTSNVVSPGPQGQTQDNTVTPCKRWYTVKAGDSCPNAEKAGGITHAQFLAWNPSVSSDCSTGFLAGFSYCVSGPVAPVLKGRMARYVR